MVGGKKVLVLINAPKEFSPHLIVIVVFSLQFSKRTRPAERMNRPFHLLFGLNKSMCRLFERIIALYFHKIQTFYFGKISWCFNKLCCLKGVINVRSQLALFYHRTQTVKS